MEPAFVEPLTEEQLNEGESIEDDIETNTIHENTLEAVEHLHLGIYAFKKELFYKIVNDEGQKTNSADMGPMMTFHSLFLNCVSYWIGLLDSKPVAIPHFGKTGLKKDFDALTNAIDKVSHNTTDARVLVYNLLSTFSTQHPFDLGKQENNLED
jgi:hypothetical protein